MGLTPDYRITGTDVNEELIREHLTSIAITDESGQKNDSCMLTFDTANNLGLPAQGSQISISLGYKETGLYPVGSFNVSKVSKAKSPQGRTLSVKAVSISSRPAMLDTKTRIFENVSIQTIIETIATEAQLQTRIDPSFAGILTTLTQDGQTNQRFAHDIADRYDAIFKVANDVLYFARRGNEVQLSSGDSLPAITIDEVNDIISYSYDFTSNTRYTRVVAKYKDETTETIQKVEAGEGDPKVELALKYKSREEALQAATALLNKSTREDGNLTFTTDATNYIPPESKITINSPDADLNAGWIVTKVDYSYSAKGVLRATYTCDVA